MVAETFLVAWRRMPEVPQYALPWLLGVARGVSTNVRRTARRRDALIDRLTAVGGQELAAVHDGGLSDALHAVVLGLRPDDRELLTLLAWDGLSREDAAGALGLSVGAVAVRLHRLRRRLRSDLARPARPEPDLELHPGVTGTTFRRGDL